MKAYISAKYYYSVSSLFLFKEMPQGCSGFGINLTGLISLKMNLSKLLCRSHIWYIWYIVRDSEVSVHILKHNYIFNVRKHIYAKSLLCDFVCSRGEKKNIANCLVLLIIKQ